MLENRIQGKQIGEGYHLYEIPKSIEHPRCVNLRGGKERKERKVRLKKKEPKTEKIDERVRERQRE